MAAFPPGWEKDMQNDKTKAQVPNMSPSGWTTTHPLRTCRKCGSDEVGVKWIIGGAKQVHPDNRHMLRKHCSFCNDETAEEHLHCACEACGWQWSTACDDAGHQAKQTAYTIKTARGGEGHKEAANE